MIIQSYGPLWPLKTVLGTVKNVKPPEINNSNHNLNSYLILTRRYRGGIVTAQRSLLR